MATSCDHYIGWIAGKNVRQSEWDTAITAFATKVHDFNVRGQRVAIPHPGYIQPFKFCTECGAQVSVDGLLSFGDALTTCEETQ